jgi:hypothetical protein
MNWRQAQEVIEVSVRFRSKGLAAPVHYNATGTAGGVAIGNDGGSPPVAAWLLLQVPIPTSAAPLSPSGPCSKPDVA